MELRQYVEIVWKRWWLIALTTVLAAVAALVVSRAQTPMYRSTTTVEIISGADPAEDSSDAAGNAETIARTYVLQISSPAVVEAVLDRLQLSMKTEDAQELMDMHPQAYKIAENPEISLPVSVNMDGFILTHAFEPVDIDIDKLKAGGGDG